MINIDAFVADTKVEIAVVSAAGAIKMSRAIRAASEKAKFISECGKCGVASPQDWDRDSLNRKLREDKLELVCQTCGQTWAPGPREQAQLIARVLGYR